jgi:peptidoglycan hydrolase CwlO-like protein
VAIQAGKTINVSTVVSVVTLLGAMGAAWAQIQSQLTETKTRIDSMQQDRQEIKNDIREIRNDMKDVSKRQDEILQRVSK